MFSDTQIVKETFVEDVTNILNNGEIPNLFALPDDTNMVLEGMNEVMKSDPKFKNLNDEQKM